MAALPTRTVDTFATSVLQVDLGEGNFLLVFFVILCGFVDLVFNDPCGRGRW